MRERFWDAPGPRRFLTESRDMLLRGDSLAMRLPPWAPDIVEAIAAQLPPQRAWIDVDDAAAQSLAPDLVLRSALGLASNDRLIGHASPHAEPIVAIRGAIGNRLRAWARTTRRHYHATRDSPGSARLILLLPAGAVLGHDDIGSVPVVEWRDCVGRFDMHIYVASLWYGRDLEVLERDLCISQSREIAGCCPLVAERLAAQGPEAAFNPRPFLADLANERCWWTATQAGWAEGAEDWRDGIRMTHAALAMAHQDERTLQRRLWSGQIEVLFPIVEALRYELAQRYQRHLTNIEDQHNGGVFEPLDVDVGPLVHRLLAVPDLPRRHRDIANAIRDVRRELAHLRPLPRSVALHPALVEAVKRGLKL